MRLRHQYLPKACASNSDMGHTMIPSLFLFHVSSNTGYAISTYEVLCYKVGLDIAGDDPRYVHFGYQSLDKGHPRFLPEGFSNLISFDFTNKDPHNIQHLVDYVNRNRIRLVMVFDIQPVHPLFRPLRKAGATAILAYWGAPISSRMPAWKLALKRLQVATSRSKVDSLIFESQAMADLAVYGRGIPERMIEVMPLGVDTARFRPIHTNYAYRALGIPRYRKIVVYAGHMERRKGVHILVEAAIEILARRRRSDVCFLICGNTADQSKEYERMYAGLGIDEWIRFAGYRKDMEQLYTSCFCGVIPSTGWDSFTCTSIEMAASGLPVVASRLQGLTEAVLNGETGLLFEPGDAQALANCLEMLLDRPELGAEYGRRGRERCERELSLEAHRRRFLAILRKWLADKGMLPICPASAN
jgi:glycosyltransferase involved in cell wall biosynthesis